MPKTIFQKVIPLHSEKNTSSFTEVPNFFISETSKTSKTSELPKPVVNELETSKLSESIKPISEVMNTFPKETDSSKPINEILSTILLTRQQHEEHLRKRAAKLGEDPDVFMTITEKDKLNSIAFQDRMETDA
ncbi:hypothetical protein C1645_813008 [Glomus cerebriforme]|uniref:Uncharacterized protein n=1 Tax=Glomus cerebriforme TaxID=658196 RepID=A0A397TJW9_9GLOM|nr:hypothetical protein C1645_813008 [Glomus cerebriforme]